MIRRRALITLCNDLSALLDAGVPIIRALDTITSGTWNRPLRRVLGSIRDAIRQGDSLEAAFSRHKGYFPALFLRLVDVGERTGNLDRVLRHIAGYLEAQDRLIRSTISNLIYPAAQFTVAILVIALAKYIMGALVSETGGKSDISSPLSAFGATGTGAALFFLLKWSGTVGLLIALYFVLTRVLRGKRIFDEVLLRVPVIGYAARTLAVARFCWTFQLTEKSGLALPEGLALAFEATGNTAFTAKAPLVLEMLREGVGLRKSLGAAGVFPPGILEVVEVGETSGKIDQCLEKAAQQAFENAAFAMKGLAQAFTWIVWLFVVGLLIYYIFCFYSGYLQTALSVMQ